MDQSTTLSEIEKLFTKRDKSILANIPTDLSAHYFIDEKAYIEFAENKLSKSEVSSKIYPFVFRFSTEHFLSFTHYEKLNIDMTQDLLVDFEDFKIKKFELNHNDYFLTIDNNFKKEEGRKIISEYLLSRYYCEDIDVLEKIFVLKKNSIVGFLSKINSNGNFLINMLNTFTFRQKILICFNIFRKLEFLYSTSIDYLDIDIRSTFLLKKEENCEDYFDILFLNKKATPNFYMRQRKHDLFNKKNLKYKKCLLNFVRTFFTVFHDDVNICGSYKVTMNFSQELLDQFISVLNNFEASAKIKEQLTETVKKFNTENQETINYHLELFNFMYIWHKIILEDKGNTFVVKNEYNRSEVSLIKNIHEQNTNIENGTMIINNITNVTNILQVENFCENNINNNEILLNNATNLKGDDSPILEKPISRKKKIFKILKLHQTENFEILNKIENEYDVIVKREQDNFANLDPNQQNNIVCKNEQKEKTETLNKIEDENKNKYGFYDQNKVMNTDETSNNTIEEKEKNFNQIEDKKKKGNNLLFRLEEQETFNFIDPDPIKEEEDNDIDNQNPYNKLNDFSNRNQKEEKKKLSNNNEDNENQFFNNNLFDFDFKDEDEEEYKGKEKLSKQKEININYKFITPKEDKQIEETKLFNTNNNKYKVSYQEANINIISNPVSQIQNFFNNYKNNADIYETYILNNSLFTNLIAKKFPRFNEISNFSITIDASKNQRLDDLIQQRDLSNEYLQEAENYYNSDNDVLALELYRNCYEMRCRCLGENNKETGIAMTGIGSVLMKLGRYKESLEMYLRSVEVFEVTVGKGDIVLASVLHNIGLIYDLLNDYDKAMEYYQEALEIKKEKLGEMNHSTGGTYYNIGGIYDIRGDFSEALRIYKIAVEIYDHSLGEVNIDSATVFNNIGLVYDKMNEPEESIENYLKSLDIFLQVLGEIHPLVATSYNNLGLVCFKMNKMEEAIENFEKCIFIRENLSHLGNYHADISGSYNNLAGIYFKLGNFDVAFEKYQNCLDITIKFIGEQTPETATAYNNLGLVCIKMNKNMEALRHFQQSFCIKSELFGEEHFETVSVIINIAGVHFKIKEFKICINYYLKALESYEKLFGKNSSQLINLLSNLGHSFNYLSQMNQAFQFYYRCLEISLFNFGEESVSTADAYFNLSNWYENTGDNESSKEYLMKSRLIKENLGCKN